LGSGLNRRGEKYTVRKKIFFLWSEPFSISFSLTGRMLRRKKGRVGMGGNASLCIFVDDLFFNPRPQKRTKRTNKTIVKPNW
jgi:hypothetical protein